MELVTNNFKLHVADQIQESFTEVANNIYYVFIGKSTPFPTATIPTPIDSQKTVLFDVYREMICGRQITPSDINLGIRRVDWAANTVYSQYRHDTDNFNNNFYVITPGLSDSYTVFKCLSNNKGAPSTYFPRLSETSADDEIYETPDGYQWKYMYSITSSQWNKFSTNEYIPVYTDANVSSNAVNGTIDYVEVTYGGSGYDMFTEGIVQGVNNIGVNQFIVIENTASTTTNFYKDCAIKIGNEIRTVAEYAVIGTVRRIKLDTPFTTTPTTSDFYYISPQITTSGFCCGDGQNFKARALVNTATANSIYKVEIVNRGTNFTFANLVAVGGVTTVSNNAIFKSSISPKNGHGFNPANELGSKNNITSVRFNSTESDNKVLDVNDFRVYGILKDPKFKEVTLNISGATGAFDVSETVVGSTSNAVGTITQAVGDQLILTNVSGFFVTGEVVSGSLSEDTAIITSVNQPTVFFNQTLILDVEAVSGTFIEDEQIQQFNSNNTLIANGSFYFANSSQMRLTNVRGNFLSSNTQLNTINTVRGIISGATAKVVEIKNRDLIEYEGEVIYIENVSPIAKAPSQTETFRIILEF